MGCVDKIIFRQTKEEAGNSTLGVLVHSRRGADPVTPAGGCRFQLAFECESISGELALEGGLGLYPKGPG